MPTNNRKGKFLYIHEMKYYTAITKDRLLLDVSIQMNLTDIMTSGRSWAQNIYSV